MSKKDKEEVRKSLDRYLIEAGSAIVDSLLLKGVVDHRSHPHPGLNVNMSYYKFSLIFPIPDEIREDCTQFPDPYSLFNLPKDKKIYLRTCRFEHSYCSECGRDGIQNDTEGWVSGAIYVKLYTRFWWDGVEDHKKVIHELQKTPTKKRIKFKKINKENT